MQRLIQTISSFEAGHLSAQGPGYERKIVAGAVEWFCSAQNGMLHEACIRLRQKSAMLLLSCNELTVTCFWQHSADRMSPE